MALLRLNTPDKRTIVSVTYGVGTHARGGCDPVWPENRLRPSLEIFRKATSPSVGDIGALNNRFSI